MVAELCMWGADGVATTIHRRDNPVREDRSAAPLIIPACRINR